MRALLLVAMLAGAAFAQPKDTTPVPKGFELYPGSRQLCSQHVHGGGGMHIAWSSHATKDALVKVVAHYEKALAAKATSEDAGAKSIKVGDRHVTIYPAASNDKLPHCETKPKAGEQTVVMLSTAAR
jgi:hypothetical protein